jgi:hypothetical protein
MKAFATIVVAFAITVTAVLTFNAFDPVQQDRRAWALERDREAQRRAWADDDTWSGDEMAVTLLLLCVAACLAGMIVDGHLRRRRLVWPRERDGALPVPYNDVVSGKLNEISALLMELRRMQEIALAQRPAVPHTYAPHLSYAPEWAYRVQGPSLPAGETHPAQSALVPAFAQLLDAGKVGRGNPLLLGYDAQSGAEQIGSWLDLYSTAVSGMPGSGKTTSQRFLACQTVLHGARFAVCDPHAGAAEDSLATTLAPLQAAFICEPANSDKAILEVVRYVADVGRRRVAGQDRDLTPLILWVDELTSLLGRSSVADELAALLERVAQEYRKRAVFVCASGQIWTAARTSSELRDSFASVLCHRMKRGQARLLLPTEEAEQVERLPTGRAVLWRTSGETTTVQIPLTTADDVRRVAGMLATGRLMGQPIRSQDEAAVKPEDMPEGSQGVAEDERLRSASVSAEAARAATLFLDGLDPAAIVWELRQVRSNQGGKYQAALSEVLGLIRVGLNRQA